MHPSMGSTPNATISTPAQLATHFREYIRVLNSGNLHYLVQYVAPRVVFNRAHFSPAELMHRIAPGTVFVADAVLADVGQRSVAARLTVEYKDAGHGGKVQRKRQHVFYAFDEDWRITRMWSVSEDYA